MNLEAAILAQVFQSPLYWERYPNLIESESSSMSWSTTYQTYLSVNAAGYLSSVYTVDGANCPKLRITVDGIITEIISTYSGADNIGIVQESQLECFNSGSVQYYWLRMPTSTSPVQVGSATGDVIPASSLGTTYTTGSPNALYILSRPLIFKSSLKIEYAMNSGTSLSGNILVRGGHV